MSKAKRWGKRGITITAMVEDDGKHRIEITGTLECPMYYPGDAYDENDRQCAIIKTADVLMTDSLIRDAVSWLNLQAPQPKSGR